MPIKGLVCPVALARLSSVTPYKRYVLEVCHKTVVVARSLVRGRVQI